MCDTEQTHSENGRPHPRNCNTDTTADTSLRSGAATRRQEFEARLLARTLNAARFRKAAAQISWSVTQTVIANDPRAIREAHALVVGMLAGALR